MPPSSITPTAPSLRILIVDDEATIRTTLNLCLTVAGHQVTECASGPLGLELAAKEVFDLVFLDLRLGTDNGLDFIPPFLAQSPWLKIVVITAYASIDSAVEAMRRGATDYLPKPFTPEQVELLAARLGEVRALESRLRTLQEALGEAQPLFTPSSKSHKAQSAYATARILAAGDSPICVVGETGTGKGTLARNIHGWSRRAAGPFTVVSCAGPSEEALAAELFGPAPAGALARLDFATGGTIYLDELPALSPRLQAKFLQLLQTGSYERENRFEPVAANVRIIVGSSVSLDQLEASGLLRKDLYYALSAHTIDLLPLRERLEDFPQLAEACLAHAAHAANRTLTGFTPDAMRYLQQYTWPGNLRELRSVIERAALLAKPPAIALGDLPPNLVKNDSAPVAIGDLVPLEVVEEQHFRAVLAKTKSLETAARILGIDYATLWRRRKKYGLD